MPEGTRPHSAEARFILKTAKRPFQACIWGRPCRFMDNRASDNGPAAFTVGASVSPLSGESTRHRGEPRHLVYSSYITLCELGVAVWPSGHATTGLANPRQGYQIEIARVDRLPEVQI